MFQPNPESLETSLDKVETSKEYSTSIEYKDKDNSTVKNHFSKHRRYIKPLATINDISFVVIDKNILEQLDLKDSTSIELEEEITQDRKGILLRIRNTTTA